MQEKAVMRTPLDRLRHTVLFEVFGLSLSIPLASVISGKEMGDMGVLAVVMAVAAMVWNWLYNFGVDKLLIRLGRDLADRPARFRVIHAICFELSFMLLNLPFVMWWLDMSLWQALTLDFGFSLFYTAYAYVYNYCYDKVFPYKRVAVSEAQ